MNAGPRSRADVLQAIGCLLVLASLVGGVAILNGWLPRHLLALSTAMLATGMPLNGVAAGMRRRVARAGGSMSPQNGRAN